MCALLFQIRLRDVTSIGQRLDAEQLWVEWCSPFDGVPVGTLSLECDAVNMVVRCLKAALHFHLDWGEEIKQQVTDSAVAYVRQKVEPGMVPGNPEKPWKKYLILESPSTALVFMKSPG